MAGGTHKIVAVRQSVRRDVDRSCGRNSSYTFYSVKHNINSGGYYYIYSDFNLFLLSICLLSASIVATCIAAHFAVCLAL